MENAHSKSANFEGRHSGGHLLGRPLLFTSETRKEEQVQIGKPPCLKPPRLAALEIINVGSVFFVQFYQGLSMWGLSNVCLLQPFPFLEPLGGLVVADNICATKYRGVLLRWA